MLYLISTPIGNLGDMSKRALDTLRLVDVIIAENISDARCLLSAYDIHGKTIIKYNDRNKHTSSKHILETLRDNDAAYITSAGTPGISDPGADLVYLARQDGIGCAIVPGPSALTSAVAMSGMRAREFTFISFPPKKPGTLRHLLERYRDQGATLVFFESTHRIIKTIQAIQDVAPKANIFVAKEMTKMFEKYFSGTSEDVIKQLQSDPKNIKGEFVVIISFDAKVRR